MRLLTLSHFAVLMLPLYTHNPMPFTIAGVSLGSVENTLPPGAPRPDINVEPSLPDELEELDKQVRSL